MQSHPSALVEVLRGKIVESQHSVCLVVCDGDGQVLFKMGEMGRPVYPRSAVKSFQAIAMVESGAAEQFAFTAEQIALACSSHNAEAVHTRAARSMLKQVGLTCGDLQCGCHNPMSPSATESLFRANEPLGPEHNNCSGKHAGFLAFARQIGVETKDYIQPDHPVQQEVAAILQALTDSPHTAANRAIDGCSIPTYAIALEAIAKAAARFATQTQMSASRAAAVQTILNACSDHPIMVAGTGRMCTRIMQVTGRRASVKVGAEGVYVAMFPELGLGAALKADDGQTRAAETLMAELTRTVLQLDGAADQILADCANPSLKNHNQMVIGSIALADETRRILATLRV